MSHRENRLLAAAFVVTVFGAAILSGQSQAPSVTGSVRGPAPGLFPAPKPPDPSLAKVMSAEEFAAAPLAIRSQTMNAWTVASPETAGQRILPMLVAGLGDADAEVRISTARVVQRISLLANIARGRKSPVGTDPHDERLYSGLVKALSDPVAAVRREIVPALLSVYAPPLPTLEQELLPRLQSESDVPVRARLVMALSVCAVAGSVTATRAVYDALDDASADVQMSAIRAMPRLKAVDWIPRVVRFLESPHPLVRRATVQSLDQMGVAAKPHLGTLVDHLTRESDASARAALERLIARLNASR